MSLSDLRTNATVDLAWNELTGAVGDLGTVLPVVVAVAVLTDLSLPVMLLWFGVFQIVWGVYYGVPVSVEPMKALAALVIAGSISPGELVVAGLLLAGALVAAGATDAFARVERFVGRPVLRGIQLGVALVLLETGVRLSLGDPRLTALAVALAAVAAVGRWQVTGVAVFLLGGAVAFLRVGVPSPAIPQVSGLVVVTTADVTVNALEASVAQLALTVGNAALATSVLLEDFFDRDITAGDLSTSMGVMNVFAVPLGGLPMCHGSGGVAGKYAFGARTAGANLLLGVGYVAMAVFAAGLVSAYPTAVLGIILALVALHLGKTSIERADSYPLAVAVGVLGVLVNLGVAFVVGVCTYSVYRRLA